MAALPLRSARSPVWICSPASSLCQCHCGHSWGMLQGYNWFHLAVLQLKGQLGPTIPDLSDTLFPLLLHLKELFLPTRQEEYNSLIFLLSVLPFYQLDIWLKVCVEKISIGTWEAAGQKK